MTKKQENKKTSVNPVNKDEQQYHLHTRRGDLSQLCLLVGDPDRAKMISGTFFKNGKKVGDHRGLRSYTGYYKNIRMSVVTTGMGAPTTGIVLPEAYNSGARIFIRVGSCGALIKEANVGDVIIVNSAVRFEGASQAWAPIEYPASAHHRVVCALEDAATKLASDKYHLGVEATTDCFNEGQARLNIDQNIPTAMQQRHEEMLRLGVACYSMEAAAIFVWCRVHCGGLLAGAINAVYINRANSKSDFKPEGEALAARIALEALKDLHDENEKNMKKVGVVARCGEEVAFEDLPLLYREALDESLEALNNSYNPYSEFFVGVTLVTSDGRIVRGTNIENAAYGSTICAERAALCNANNQGIRNIKAIAIIAKGKNFETNIVTSPCGACRQMLFEASQISGVDIDVVMSTTLKDKVVVAKISALLPLAFGPLDIGMDISKWQPK